MYIDQKASGHNVMPGTCKSHSHQWLAQPHEKIVGLELAGKHESGAKQLLATEQCRRGQQCAWTASSWVQKLKLVLCICVINEHTFASFSFLTCRMNKRFIGFALSCLPMCFFFGHRCHCEREDVACACTGALVCVCVCVCVWVCVCV